MNGGEARDETQKANEAARRSQKKPAAEGQKKPASVSTSLEISLPKPKSTVPQVAKPTPESSEIRSQTLTKAQQDAIALKKIEKKIES